MGNSMGKLGQWLQVGANVGILASLILVALQMQQSIDLARIQLENQMAEADTATEMTIAGESGYAPYAGITAPELTS